MSSPLSLQPSLKFSQLPLVPQPLGVEDCFPYLALSRKKGCFQMSTLVQDLILLASGVAAYSEVEQTRCDIPVIGSSNNLIILHDISPGAMIWQCW